MGLGGRCFAECAWPFFAVWAGYRRGLLVGGWRFEVSGAKGVHICECAHIPDSPVLQFSLAVETANRDGRRAFVFGRPTFFSITQWQYGVSGRCFAGHIRVLFAVCGLGTGGSAGRG